jgi:hypothetical protein
MWLLRNEDMVAINEIDVFINRDRRGIRHCLIVRPSRLFVAHVARGENVWLSNKKKSAGNI